MKRILHIVATMDRGGLETLIMNLYRNIDREKMQFDFLVHTNNISHYDNEIISMGGKIFRIPDRRENWVMNRKALNAFFNNHPEYTIIHQHVSSLNYITPLVFAKKNGVQTRIVHSHSSTLLGNKISGFLHYLNKPIIKNIATHYFTCSDLASEWLYGNFVSKQEIKTIYNAVEVSKFVFNEKIRKTIRSKYDLEDKLVVGHIGNFTFPKNHSFLLDVFNEINKVVDNAELILVGDGKLRPDIENKINSLNLKDKVKLLGTRSDINKLLQAFDVVIFPSHYEGLPVALIEAQCAGLKCFVSDTITDEVRVTDLVKFKSLEESAESWATDILSSGDYIRENKSTEIIKSGFNLEEVAQNLQKFYLKVF